MSKTKTTILLIFILAVGLFLRAYDINHAPPGVYPDEAVNGEDALRAIETGEYQWFYPSNQGREGLFMNLIAFCFQIFGPSVLALKFPSIIFGTLTILGTYLLAKELFGRRAGFISAWLAAVSFWAINFSRISFRANMLPAVLAFSFYFLWKGLRTKKWYDFAIGGFIFGIGIHTYIAWRIAPAILFILLFSLIISRKNFLKEYWRAIVIFTLFSLLSAAPMFYTFYVHPEYLESRSDNISVLSPKVNGGHLTETLTRSLGLSLVKYNFWGDQNWRHNYPPYPILDPLSGILFLFGLIFSLIKILHFLRLRLFQKIPSPAMDKYVFLMAWFFLMLAPEFMTAEGLPHALRAIGTQPVVFIFSGLALNYIFRKSENYNPISRKVVSAVIILMLVFIGVFNGVKYHLFWAKKIETARSFEKTLLDVSDYIRTIPAKKEKFIVTETMQRIPIKIFNPKMPNVSYFYPKEAAQINPRGEDFEIILTERNDEAISILQNKFSELKLEEKKDELGLSFCVLR